MSTFDGVAEFRIVEEGPPFPANTHTHTLTNAKQALAHIFLLSTFSNTLTMNDYDNWRLCLSVLHDIICSISL